MNLKQLIFTWKGLQLVLVLFASTDIRLFKVKVSLYIFSVEKGYNQLNFTGLELY